MFRSDLEIKVGWHIPVCVGEVEEVQALEMLGSGGYGSAWKVKDRRSERLYTLKVIGGIVPGSVDEQRVRMEAEVSIPSDYIVRAAGLCQWDANTFLILFDYFPSRSLDKILAEGRLTHEQKRRIWKQTLLGVRDAHRHNIIHRDLKPGNILVGAGDQVKLIDFGISKFKSRAGITQTGTLIGTLPYIAPELITSEGARIADARADIYSLGHVFYELVVGECFWLHKGWRELDDVITFMRQVPKPTEIIELDDFHCDLYDSAGEVLRRMVKLDLAERYRSIDEVLTDLGEIEKSVPPPVAPKPIRKTGRPMLIVESGSNQGARTVVSLDDGDSMIFGRADIAGNDLSIGREHFELTRLGQSYFVRDLRSKNGTFVEGVMLRPGEPPKELNDGDRIRVGDVFLRFAFVGEL